MRCNIMFRSGQPLPKLGGRGTPSAETETPAPIRGCAHGFGYVGAVRMSPLADTKKP